jgi:hypothetical protein
LGVVRPIDTCDLFQRGPGHQESPEIAEGKRGRNGDTIRSQRRSHWWDDPEEPRGYKTPMPEWADWRDRFRPKLQALLDAIDERRGRR